MRKMLLTTALLTAMSTMPALAQSAMPPDFVAPEGYQSATADTLTFEDLTGATVYDVRGESIGDISDFIMELEPSTDGVSAPATDGMTSDGSAVDATGTGTTATDGNVSAGTDTTTEGTVAGTTATDEVTIEGTGTAATDSTVATTGTEGTDSTATESDMATTGTTATEGATAEGTGTSTVTDGTVATTEGTTTNTTASDTTETDETMTEETVATDSTVATTGTEGTAADTTLSTDVAAEDGMAGTDAAGNRTGSISGQVTHAIIDVGGFLGIGTHTVAVPIEALQVYRGSSAADVRVYLPWNEEQLERMPEYVEGDQSTLGTVESVTQ
jgi:hypothetical protein